MGINNGYDRWLTTPPDEPEAEYCESCGQEMTYHEYTYSGGYPSDKYFTCENQFCPEKFEKYKGGTISVVLDMSNHLVEVEQELADTKADVKFLRSRVNHLEKLTQSQQGE